MHGTTIKKEEGRVYCVETSLLYDFNNDNQHAQFVDVLTHNRNNSHFKYIIKQK